MFKISVPTSALYQVIGQSYLDGSTNITIEHLPQDDYDSIRLSGSDSHTSCVINDVKYDWNFKFSIDPDHTFASFPLTFSDLDDIRSMLLFSIDDCKHSFDNSSPADQKKLGLVLSRLQNLLDRLEMFRSDYCETRNK